MNDMTMLVIDDFWEDFVDFLTISKFSLPAIYIENKYTIHVIATYVNVNVNVTDTILWQGHHDRVMQLTYCVLFVSL